MSNPADFRALAARVDTEAPSEDLQQTVMMALGWWCAANVGDPPNAP